MHHCQYHSFESSFDMIRDPYGPINHTVERTKRISPDNYTSVHITVCFSFHGSFWYKPSTVLCTVDNSTADWSNATTSLMESCDKNSLPDDVMSALVYDASVTRTYEPCSKTNVDLNRAYNKISWYLAKTNYFLTICGLVPNMLAVFLLKFCKIFGGWHQKYILLLVIGNSLWLVWRLQETLNWDTKWRDLVPYICHLTSVLQYCAESLSISIFCCVSVRRFFAILYPLESLAAHASRSTVKTIFLPSLIVTIVCSALTSGVLLALGDPYSTAYCKVSATKDQPMLFLMISSISVGVGLYAVPSVLNIVVSVAVAVSVIKREKETSLNSTSSRKSSKAKLMTIIASALFQLSWLLKPIYDLNIAITLYATNVTVWSKAAEVYFEALMWNVTTIAYSLNVFGIYHLVVGRHNTNRSRNVSTEHMTT